MNVTYLLFKAMLSGVLIAVASEVARRWPGFGALIASLPLISLLGMIWLWRDTADIERLADHTQATLWFIAPSVPMFVLMPWLWRAGVSFWAGLGIGCILTVMLYLLMIWGASRMGIRL